MLKGIRKGLREGGVNGRGNSRGMAVAVSLALALIPCVAAAQADYAKRIKMYETIQPLGDTPFGENINLYTGELSFLQTDIELEGNGPAIVLARDMISSPVAAFNHSSSSIDSFGRWSLTIPRIEVLVKSTSSEPGVNWQVPVYPPSGAPTPSPSRCTNFGVPYDADENVWVWWQEGYEFTTERGQKQQMLRRATENTLKPSMLKPDGTPYVFPIVTQQNWQIGCLANTSNGQIGEGFLAVSPEGTKYYLDYLVGVPASPVYEQIPDVNRPITHRRMAATMFVRRIEDRFGNYLTYNYTGTKLASISASDGRLVTIQWRQDGVHRISSITVQPATGAARVWQYQYSGNDLIGVTLPDSSRWEFGISNSPRPVTITNSCLTRTSASVVGPEVAFTLKTPSGLTGNFLLSGAYHARSYVPSECRVYSGFYAEEHFPLFGTGSLIRKTFSGPGVPETVWNYAYSPATGSTTQDACAQNGTCSDTRWVEVTNPDGSKERHTLSTRWGATEGKTVKVERSKAGVLKRTELFTYAAPDHGPYPADLGAALDDFEANNWKNRTWTPVLNSVILQDGTRFSSTVSEFDSYARPIRVTKGSTPVP